MNWKKILQDKRWFWIGLGLLAVLLRLALSPEMIERYYSRGLFLVIRRGIDTIMGILPFASVYLLFFILLGVLIFQGYRFFNSNTTWPKKIGNALFSWLAFSGGVVFFFLILWGFNYGRVPLERQLGLAAKPLAMEELKEELDSTTAMLSTLRAKLPGVSDEAVSADFLPPHLEKTLRAELQRLLRQLGYPAVGKVRGRLLFPKGILLRISTAGVYIPFTGEGHVDPGLHSLQLPFVMAHEMAHGYGFGDEGTCNFLAYLCCIQSKEPVIQYVGYLNYWRYVASNYRRHKREDYWKFYENELPNGIKNDLNAIYEEMEKYPDILPKVRNYAYNSYLKAQGISEGMKNYSRILMLVHAWRKR